MAPVKAAPKTHEFRSQGLHEAPEVDALLTELGLGRFDPATVRGLMGRNQNWSGRTTTGTDVFVKKISGDSHQRRLESSLHVAYVAARTVTMPALLGSDLEHSLIVTSYLPDSVGGRDLAIGADPDPQFSSTAGELIARFHNLPTQGFSTEEHRYPLLEPLYGLAMPYFEQASAAELTMWRMLQPDAAFVAGVEAMKREDHELCTGQRPDVQLTPIHADLRFDQYLASDQVIYLTDFEEARVGDPARDVGSFLGEWLYDAVTSIPKTLAEALPVGQAPTHAQIVATGVAEIEARYAPMRAFVTAYRSCRTSSLDPGFARRAIRYAGWHAVDRMFAQAALSHALSSTVKAAAGIGRMLILHPDEFLASLGLEA